MLAIIAAIENDFEREFITQIYLTYYKKMRAKAFFIIHDEGEADEIVQESFVKLIEHVQDLMRIDPIKVPVYVMVTVRNISITHWHKAKKEKENQVLIDDYDLDRWAMDEMHCRKKSIYTKKIWKHSRICCLNFRRKTEWYWKLNIFLNFQMKKLLKNLILQQKV